MLFRREHAFLSNFYPCEIHYKDMVFASTEAAYQSQKTDDIDEQAKFQDYTAEQAKCMGHAVEISPTFDERKVQIMRELIDIKFRDPELAFALSKVPLPIVEDNTWGDTFWGKCDGVGENMLGKILTEKAMEIKKSISNKKR